MSAWDTPSEKCPYCGTECEADWVDVEVGMIQCGPYYCENCGASSVGLYDPPRDDPEAARTGWYAPGTPCSPLANAIGGVPIDHVAAKRIYEMQYDSDFKILDKKPSKFDLE